MHLKFKLNLIHFRMNLIDWFDSFENCSSFSFDFYFQSKISSYPKFLFTSKLRLCSMDGWTDAYHCRRTTRVRSPSIIIIRSKFNFLKFILIDWLDRNLCDLLLHHFPVLKSRAVLQIANRSQHIQDGKIERVVVITGQTSL